MSSFSNKERSAKRRPRPSFRKDESPAFLDAAASISASTFGARRLPEIKALYYGTQLSSSSSASASALRVNADEETDEYQSGGAKRSSRHLRRRATSHLSRKRHRYPRCDAPEGNITAKATTTEIRTTDKHDKKRPCRRARRRPALLHQSHESWNASKDDIEGGSACSSRSQNANWMMTHLWHAKRFHLRTLWNWKVPLMHSNRGARASLRLARQNGALVQDATWAEQTLVVSCPQLESLLAALHRVCPQLLQISSTCTPSSILCGNAQGEGVCFEPDQFPKGAIGPVSWWTTRNYLVNLSSMPDDDEDDTSSKNGWFHVHFSVHPSILECMKRALDFVVAVTPGSEGPHVLRLARLRIRGKRSTDVLRSFAPCPADSLTQFCYNWTKLGANNDTHTRLPHGTILGVQANLRNDQIDDDDDDDDEDDNKQQNEIDGTAHILGIQEKVLQWNPAVQDYPPRSLEGENNNNLLLVSRCPRATNSTLPQNEAVCGWDIVCHPRMAMELLMRLTNAGKACAIGLVDDVQARMECEPPLPVFPRDFPDTVQGQRYWNQTDGDCPWRSVRQCLESGGLGRVVMPSGSSSRKANSKKQVSAIRIDWGILTEYDPNVSVQGNISSPEPNDDATIVVVRGALFGQPFLDSLAASSNLPSSSSSQEQTQGKKCRRPRRRVRSPYESVRTLSLSSEQARAHTNNCNGLLASLSLPALLQCHIVLADRGSLAPGAHIILELSNGSAKDEKTTLLLGKVNSGAYSFARGRCHGVGFLGAKRLLQVLSSDQAHANTAAITSSNGKRQVVLRVIIRDSDTVCTERKANVSLQL